MARENLGIPAVKVGHLLRFRERDVEAWLTAHETRQAS
jgi:excisionase family DNA binding protein